ncbi:hypothetical protein [Amorphus orientalis]|uniref:Uncharacterized protein n=1 Tax=Amorphus orientalis TaxID=649198 RepID=A0AAE4ATX6_9HYPH|nr:hypothetical protein [Amorphus orientalis]MDQ0317741.1 hypothetical protein [Amorphus orientalis]
MYFETNVETGRDLPNLPFIDAGGGFPYWSVEGSDDWSRDVKRGAEYARLAVREVRDRDDPGLLGKILRDMMHREAIEGEASGAGVGFITEISRMSIRGSART